MKSFGGIPNEDELIPLMQSQQDKILEELNQAAENIQRTGCEGHNEVLEALNYVLEQSTSHKQDVEQDLKDTRERNETLQTAVEQLYNATQSGVENLAEELRSTRKLIIGLLFMTGGTALISIGTLLAVLSLLGAGA